MGKLTDEAAAGAGKSAWGEPGGRGVPMKRLSMEILTARLRGF